MESGALCIESNQRGEPDTLVGYITHITHVKDEVMIGRCQVMQHRLSALGHQFALCPESP